MTQFVQAAGAVGDRVLWINVDNVTIVEAVTEERCRVHFVDGSSKDLGISAPAFVKTIAGAIR